MSLINAIKAKIAKGEVEEAFSLMIKYSKSAYPAGYTQILVLSCQMHQWMAQKRLGLNPPETTFNRIILSVTDFLEEFREEDFRSAVSSGLHHLRITQLEEKVRETYLLLGEWEDKRDLSENPSERKRSTMEIQKLKVVCDEYLEELNDLVFLQKKN